MYTIILSFNTLADAHLLRPNLLQLLRTVHKLVCICLGNHLPLIWLLHEKLITLLVGKSNGILLGLEVEVCALHEIGTALPAHQRVFPSVTLTERVPIHTPVVRVPVAGLRCGFGGFVDAE